MKIIACIPIFLFIIVTSANAGPNDPVTESWAKSNLDNAKKTSKIPNWKITTDGIARQVTWSNHDDNKRFAIYDPNDDSDPLVPATFTDDLVLDKETGLVWARDMNLAGARLTWNNALNFARNSTLGNRMGWRVPTVEELSSVVDPSQSFPVLPAGHPFINIEDGEPGFGLFWTSTVIESSSDFILIVSFVTTPPSIVTTSGKDQNRQLLIVRGGNN